MLDTHRSRASPYLDRLAASFPSWSPAELSWLSFSFFVLAALLLASLRWLSAYGTLVATTLFAATAVLVFAGGVFDALDGHVARMRQLASTKGDLLDHVLDRYADVLVLLGIAVSGWAQPVLALLALASLLLVSYMGTQAQAVLGHRLYGGWLGRADRIVLVSLASLLMAFLLFFDWLLPSGLRVPYRFSVLGVGLTPLDLVLLIFILLSQATALWRARWTWQELSKRSPPPGGAPSPSPGRPMEP